MPIAWLAAMTRSHDLGASRPSTCASADRVFGPMEERVRERASARFTCASDDGAAPAGTADARTAPAAAATTEGSAR